MGMTLRAGHNQICVDQILGVSWNTRLWNINLRHVNGIIRYNTFMSWNALLMKIPYQTKGSIWRKRNKSWGNCVFHVFCKGFHPNTFRDIFIKCFNWIITKWRTQCHSCSWAIHHKSLLNIQYSNFEHTTTKCIIFATSPDHINWSGTAMRPSPKRRHFPDDIFIFIKIFFIENCGFYIRASSVCSTPGSNWQYVKGTIGLDNGLAPSKWDAIISANGDIPHRCVVGLGELCFKIFIYNVMVL